MLGDRDLLSCDLLDFGKKSMVEYGGGGGNEGGWIYS